MWLITTVLSVALVLVALGDALAVHEDWADDGSAS
jgi:hypothetical protein